MSTACPRMPTTPPLHAHEMSTCLGGRSRDCGWTSKMPWYGCPRKANCTATLHPLALLRMTTYFQEHPRNASRCHTWTHVDGQYKATLGIHDTPNVDLRKHWWKSTRLGCGLGWMTIEASSWATTEYCWTATKSAWESIASSFG